MRLDVSTSDGGGHRRPGVLVPRRRAAAHERPRGRRHHVDRRRPDRRPPLRRGSSSAPTRSPTSPSSTSTASDLPVAVLGTVGGPRGGRARPSPSARRSGSRAAPSVTTGVISARRAAHRGAGGETAPRHDPDRRADRARVVGRRRSSTPTAPSSGSPPRSPAERGARFGFATPIDLARRVADQLLEHGHMVARLARCRGRRPHRWPRRTDGRDRRGARARRSLAGSPAAAAGLHGRRRHHRGRRRTRCSSISGLVVALREHEPGRRRSSSATGATAATPIDRHPRRAALMRACSGRR